MKNNQNIKVRKNLGIIIRIEIMTNKCIFAILML